MDIFWEWIVPALALAPVLVALTILRKDLGRAGHKKALGVYLGVVTLTFTPLVLALFHWLLFKPEGPDWFQGWGWMQLMAFIPGGLIGAFAWLRLVLLQVQLVKGKEEREEREEPEPTS